MIHPQIDTMFMPGLEMIANALLNANAITEREAAGNASNPKQ
jgi:hypothetical protein